jgi:hypothetical protein
MLRFPHLFAPRFRVRAGIAILLAVMGGPAARAGSGFKDIAYFEEGTVATLTIVVEYKPDGSRSTNLRINRPPQGGSMFFHEAEWKAFTDNLSRVKGGADGMEQVFADIATPGGSLLSMAAVRHGGEITLTLIRQPDKGDSSPPVPFHLQPADFGNLLKATVEAAQANIVVSASSAGELARFRAELGARFTPEQLQDFDTAVLELRLDAGNRGTATEPGRDSDMLAVVNRKFLPDVVLLGWRARKARLIREIPEAIRLVNQDTAEAAKTAPTGTPESVTRRLAAEKEVLAQLRRDRDDTIRRLAELAEPIGKPH